MNGDRSERVPGPNQVSRALLGKYAVSGPRYTSYPTAPHFREEFDQARVRAAWAASNIAGRGLSLYMHLPFCRRRCLYCGCNTEIGHTRSTTDAYVDAMLCEADHLLTLIDRDRPVEQLALGGGTPTFLSREQMARLVAGLRGRFHFPEKGERSLEIDPRSVDEEYLDGLLDLGFNRMSFGVQDLDPVVQRNIGRVQPAGKVAALLDHLHGRGMSALNVDLIYGLPGQTPDRFGATVRAVAGMRPSRIAMFGYAHVPWISPHQKALENRGLPDAEARMELFGLGFELLLQAGYRHVGMDHFALPEDELVTALEQHTLTRNFMGYTTHRGLDLVGLGASSISAVGHSFTQNAKDVACYLERAQGGAWMKALLVNAEDLLRREIIIDLFCNFHLDRRRIEESFGIDFGVHFSSELACLAPLQADGLLEVADGDITVSGLGRFFIRNICMVFDQYLDDGAQRYSRTH